MEELQQRNKMLEEETMAQKHIIHLEKLKTEKVPLTLLPSFCPPVLLCFSSSLLPPPPPPLLPPSLHTILLVFPLTPPSLHTYTHPKEYAEMKEQKSRLMVQLEQEKIKLQEDIAKLKVCV